MTDKIEKMSLKTINYVMDKLELHKCMKECQGQNTELLNKCIEVARYAKHKFLIDKRKMKDIMGGTNNPKKKEKKKDPY